MSKGAFIPPGKIDIRFWLDEYEITYKESGEGWLAIHCPNPEHKDNTPSCGINIHTGAYKCQSCNDKGSILRVLASGKGKHDVNTIYDRIASETPGLKVGKKLLPIDKWVEPHEALLKDPNKALKSVFLPRGINLELIKQARIGFATTQKAYTIPVFDESGALVNIRYYRPGAPSNLKYANHRGISGKDLYPIEQLEYTTIVICGGELKALAALNVLNKQGVGAICYTGGEGNLPASLAKRFLDMDEVFICMDIDEAGRRAARRLYNQCIGLGFTTYIITLPLNQKKHPKGDINDFIGIENGDLYQEVKNAGKNLETPSLDSRVARHLYSSTTPISILDMKRNNSPNKRYEIKGRLTALSSSEGTQNIPSKVTVDCKRDRPMCMYCPISLKAKEVVYELPLEGDFVTQCSWKSKDIKENLKIPEACKTHTIEVEEYTAIISGKIKGMKDDDSINLMAKLSESEALIPGQLYSFSGSCSSDFKNTVCFSSTNYQNLDSAILEQFDTNNLQKLRPEENTVKGILDHLKYIAKQYENHVTNTRSRPLLHILIDLTMHSVLNYIEPGGAVKSGWLQTIIVGDAGTGKSQTATKLREYYNHGSKIDAGSATTAGLKGGVTDGPAGKKIIEWGEFVFADSGALFIEEFGKLSLESIQTLTEMRSSGKVSISKIAKGEANARTRLICLSNPRQGSSIQHSKSGLDAVVAVIGQPEDLRRFDFIHAVHTSDVADELIYRPIAESKKDLDDFLNPKLSHSLIAWAWSRKAENCIVTEENMQLVYQYSTNIKSKYRSSHDVIRHDIKEKILKTAFAIAVRVGSTIDGENVLLLPQHVEAAYEIMTLMYEHKNLGIISSSKLIKGMALPQDRVKSLLKRLMTEPLMNAVDRLHAKRCLPLREAHSVKSELDVLSGAGLVIVDDQGYMCSESFIKYLNAKWEDDKLIFVRSHRKAEY